MGDDRGKLLVFWTQAGFSAVGVAFTASMLMLGKDPGIYLPIFTSILFAWLPSPLHKTEKNKDSTNVVSFPLQNQTDNV